MGAWTQELTLRRGERAAAIMSLIQSARLNRHAAYTYLKDVRTPLPMQRASKITEVLPHRWDQANQDIPTLSDQLRYSLHGRSLGTSPQNV